MKLASQRRQRSFSVAVLKENPVAIAVVIAPSHHARFDGVSVYDGEGYRTPLGPMPIEQDLVKALKKGDSKIRHLSISPSHGPDQSSP